MRKKIEAIVGFADSEFISYQRKVSEFRIWIDAWNNKRFKISFLNFEALVDYGIGDISEFVEETQSNPFLEEVISLIYTSIPESHPYRIFQFLDLDGRPSLEIIAADVNIVMES